MIAYGFAHTAPDKVLVHLRKLGTPRSAIALVASPAKFEQRKHVVFSDVFTFEAHRKSITDKTICYVCDDPISLSMYNVIPVDYKAAEAFHVDGFNLVEFKSIPASKQQHITRTKFDVVEAAKKVAREQHTFLMNFMSFVYTMPSSTHQTPVRQLVCKWLASTETEKQLQTRVASLSKKIKLTDKQVAKLMDLLSGEVVDLYRKALQMEGDEDDVAMKLKISAYEMRYIRAINSGVEKKEGME